MCEGLFLLSLFTINYFVNDVLALLFGLYQHWSYI